MHNIKILVNGAHGKMGSIAVKALSTQPNFTIVAQLGKQDNLEKQIIATNPDVILDLTTADCVWQNCMIYSKNPARFVIGTSGLNANQIQELQHQCQIKQQGAVVVPNFSIGAVLTMQFAKMAAKWFDGVDIIEMHHHKKIDAPSGTALFTAQLINEQKDTWPEVNTNAQPGRETFIQQIPVHSVRMPGILAKQDIMFGQLGETITLSHQTIDRQAYMPGLILACSRVMELNTMQIGLEHWLLEHSHAKNYTA